MQFDEALEVVGDFGLFQWLLVGYLALFMVPMHAVPMSAHVFTLLEPPHWCRQPELEEVFHLTPEEARELAVPRVPDGSWSRCTVYELNLTSLGPWMVEQKENRSLLPARDLLPVVPCRSGWHYDYSLIYPTIVSEMDWVCDQNWKVYVSHSVFFGSMSVGVIFFGAISDRIGRVPVMAAVYLITGVGALATYFSNDFYVFLVTRFIQGGVLLSICNIPFVLALEYMPAEKRMFMLGSFRFVYPLVGAAMPWVAYAIGHWRLLNAAIMLPCLIGAIVSPFVPESTRWLLSTGNTDKAKEVLLRIGRVNGKHVQRTAIESLQAPEKGDKATASTAAIFKYPNLRRSFVLTFFVRLLACVSHQAGQLYAAAATDDPFVMTSITNVVDVLGIWLAVPMADKCGRRFTMASTCAVAGLCYLVGAGLYANSVAIFASLMAGRAVQTIAYNVGCMHAAEIYPTEIRTQGLSIRQAFGSIGKFLSSNVVQLAIFGRFLPLTVLGVISCLSALMALPLPETSNQRLPETMQEAEARHTVSSPWLPGFSRTGTGKGKYNISTISAAVARLPCPRLSPKKERTDLCGDPGVYLGSVRSAQLSVRSDTHL
uniref:Integral to membrane n=1 Tax=Rhipicephalus zambeziensis TaxID=60191 RepID=A0A224Z2G6_9ACAR